MLLTLASRPSFIASKENRKCLLIYSELQKRSKRERGFFEYVTDLFFGKSSGVQAESLLAII